MIIRLSGNYEQFCDLIGNNRPERHLVSSFDENIFQTISLAVYETKFVFIIDRWNSCCIIPMMTTTISGL